MSSSDPPKKPRPGPWPPVPEAAPMPPSSWAKRTGFRPKFSGETNATDSGQISALPLPPRPPPSKVDANVDLEAGRPRPGPTSNGEPAGVGKENRDKERKEKEQVRKRRDSDGGKESNGKAEAVVIDGEGSRRAVRNEETTVAGGRGGGDVLHQSVLDDDGFVGNGHSNIKYELRDTPGLGEHVNLVSCFIWSGLILKKSMLLPIRP